MKLLFCPYPAAWILRRTEDKQLDILLNHLALHGFKIQIIPHILQLQGIADQTTAAALYRFCERIIGRGVDHNGIPFLTEALHDIMQGTAGSKGQLDPFLFNIHLKAAFIPADQGIVIGIIRIRIAIIPQSRSLDHRLFDCRSTFKIQICQIHGNRFLIQTEFLFQNRIIPLAAFAELAVDYVIKIVLHIIFPPV